MEIYKAKIISPGYAEGKAYVYGSPTEKRNIPYYKIQSGDIDGENERFHKALEHSYRELEQIRDRMVGEIGEAESRIFMSHLAMLQDRDFIEKIMDRVRQDLINVEQALDLEMDRLVQLLGEVEHEYLRERSEDIRDVGRRVLKHLGIDKDSISAQLPENTVLIAKELLPSETLNIDRKNIVSIVTERGGTTSHSSILARSLGIPAVTGIPGITGLVPQGTPVLVDGENGRLIVAPDEHELSVFSGNKVRYEKLLIEAEKAEGSACITKDGKAVHLFANIGRSEEASEIAEHSLEGVGLFRTEYLFLGRKIPPSKNEHYRAYLHAAEQLGDRIVTIRTLDLGGDKIPEFVKKKMETNPTIGMRGLRFSLLEEELFTAQIEACLELSRTKQVRILFPMVIGGSDFQKAADIVESIAERLQVPSIPPLGAMIETPAAVFSIEEILERADFISIGTNDLTQLILAADRNEVGLVDYYSVLHPSVLRAVRQVVDTANEYGVEVSICGEAGGNYKLAPLFIGMGIRYFSMSPKSAAQVHRTIRGINVDEAEKLSRMALSQDSPEAVQQVLQDFISVILADG
jgi:phosphoenolpyruvate-protein phosphotransferase (PTS system enzyme I)